MTGYGGERRNCIQRCLYDKENDSSEKQGFKVSVGFEDCSYSVVCSVEGGKMGNAFQVSCHMWVL